MIVFTAMLMLQLHLGRACWRRWTGNAVRWSALQKEHHVLLGWAGGYVLIAVAAGAAGMAGIAGGLALHHLLPLLALSALTLAASLLHGIAAMLACLAALPRLGVHPAAKRFR